MYTAKCTEVDSIPGALFTSFGRVASIRRNLTDVVVFKGLAEVHVFGVKLDREGVDLCQEGDSNMVLKLELVA
jgi:hypothetical protein